jgi:hypothetical protein
VSIANRGFNRVPRGLREYFRNIEEWAAWLFLVESARGIAGGGLDRGQLQLSYTELAKAWGWKRERVRHFIVARQSTGSAAHRHGSNWRWHCSVKCRLYLCSSNHEVSTTAAPLLGLFD